MLNILLVIGIINFLSFFFQHEVYNPETLMRSILRNIHYIPDNWNLNAHTNWVRDEFAQLFQYRFVSTEYLSNFLY